MTAGVTLGPLVTENASVWKIPYSGRQDGSPRFLHKRSCISKQVQWLNSPFFRHHFPPSLHSFIVSLPPLSLPLSLTLSSSPLPPSSPPSLSPSYNTSFPPPTFPFLPPSSPSLLPLQLQQFLLQTVVLSHLSPSLAACEGGGGWKHA